jgi:hypothetical protein
LTIINNHDTVKKMSNFSKIITTTTTTP